MTLSVKQILILVSVLFLLVLGGYYYIFYIIKNKNEKISTFSQEIELYSQRESLRKATEKTADDLSEKITKLESYFLHKDELVPFIEKIEDSGKRMNVSVSIISVNLDESLKGAQAKNGERFVLRLNTKGSWSNVVKFVSYLENLPYKIFVSRVSFIKDSALKPFFITEDGPKAVSFENDTASTWSANIEMSVLTLN
jgi:hypothetical protein